MVMPEYMHIYISYKSEDQLICIEMYNILFEATPYRWKFRRSLAEITVIQSNPPEKNNNLSKYLQAYYDGRT